MANNAQKIPFQSSLNRFGEKKVNDAIQKLGKALPCSVVSVNGQIVTVKFELDNQPFTLPQITIPVLTFEYIRYPIQVGDKGMTIAADVRLGGISGLGSGSASLVPAANLTMLVFVPVANSNWTASPDPNKIVLYGPNGAILKSTNGSAQVDVDGTDVTITATNINLNGIVKINGFDYMVHKHGGVQTGGGTSGGVVP